MVTGVGIQARETWDLIGSHFFLEPCLHDLRTNQCELYVISEGRTFLTEDNVLFLSFHRLSTFGLSPSFNMAYFPSNPVCSYRYQIAGPITFESKIRLLLWNLNNRCTRSSEKLIERNRKWQQLVFVRTQLQTNEKILEFFLFWI